MFSLTGWPFMALVVLATTAAFVALVVWWPSLSGRGWRRFAGRAGLLLGVNVLVLLTAATQLNAQFLYFADWTDLEGALSGTVTTTTLQRGATATDAASRAVAGAAAQRATGRLPALATTTDGSGDLLYTVRGPRSGVTGLVVVRLPAGYASHANASVRYPVLETFHGYPGSPFTWVRSMGLGSALAHQVAAHRMRPALIVSPDLQVPAGADTECVNGRPGTPQMETWLTRDVPEWVARTFRVSTNRSSWATIGISSGGWCAAMAAMLHPAQYSAAVVMGGYFRPELGPSYEPYAPGSALARRYDLVALTRRRPAPVALWMETSHTDPVSYTSSAELLKVARPPLAIDATVLQHAGHRAAVWLGLLPGALGWLGLNVPGFAPTS
ncbi:alpha/beta hydrolase [Oryzihumus leptocrescens]|uniref:Putative esterase n=1 Tax=Oryzihumus leptocrescens TaxID=297536 RepID=A0A542ZHU6_9MICO|nr:putative esterase [Oryzihumus leptocrescens]